MAKVGPIMTIPGGLYCYLTLDLGQRLDLDPLISPVPGRPLILVPVINPADPSGLFWMPGPGPVSIPAFGGRGRNAAGRHVGATNHGTPIDRRNCSYLLAELYTQAARQAASGLVALRTTRKS